MTTVLPSLPPDTLEKPATVDGPMAGPFATRLFRIVLALAGCYNLAFGLWAGFWPLAFFQIFDLPPPRYPAIWACLGMVVGVYGLLYLYAAWKPDRGKPMIFVGLLGKALGPIGMVYTFSDEWPLRLAMLNVYNDLIWLLPFSLFLIRDWRVSRPLVILAPWACAILHGLALAAMALFLQPGSLTESEVLRRAAYLSEHQAAWTAGWALWMLSAASLVAFYAWWGSRLNAPLWATTAVLIASVGMVCDTTGESLSVLLLVEQARDAAASTNLAAWNPAAFEQIERTTTLLTAATANGLYTLAGVMLTLKTPNLPRWIRAAMWGTWIAGAGMTVAGLLNHVGGMVATTAVLFPLFLVWVTWMAWRGRPA